MYLAHGGEIMYAQRRPADARMLVESAVYAGAEPRCDPWSAARRVDQAHRGYSVTTDAAGFASCNPLYMSYEPDAEGNFAGQLGYGYRSIAAFVDACRALNEGRTTVSALDARLPTLRATLLTTAILEAGARSLVADGARMTLLYDDTGVVRDLRSAV